MENIHWKAIFISLAIIVALVCFKQVLDFFTFVVTDFVETAVTIIKVGFSGRGRDGIEPIVRFCLMVIIIFGLIRLFKGKPEE